MIHGTTKMELTYDSVLEAIQEWWDGHMASNVKVKVGKWSQISNANYGTPTGLNIEFTQVDPSAESAAKPGADHDA